MTKLRTLLAAAATAATLGIAALAATPASAHGFGEHGGFRHGFGHFHEHFRFHEGWRRFGWSGPHHYCGWHFCGPRYGWGYGGGYGVVIGEAPVCPEGYHLGHLGRRCWPNRD